MKISSIDKQDRKEGGEGMEKRKRRGKWSEILEIKNTVRVQLGRVPGRIKPSI